MNKDLTQGKAKAERHSEARVLFLPLPRGQEDSLGCTENSRSWAIG